DPSIVVLMANRFFPACRHYSVFAEEALNDYGFFRKIGAIGVDPASPASVRQFIRVGRSVLSSPKQVFWMTPQGAFRDVRERPAAFKPGLALLARRLPGFDFLPMAIEYPFWDERFPEALLAFGEMTPSEAVASQGAGVLEATLNALQDRLANGAKSRDAQMFRSLEIGSFGVGGVYDHWRRFSNWLRGKSFSTRHGAAPE
ncbi:MAG: lysophospholipid acyltransferase family protein, partial [bacterium]|nr:lysophospholipid acyltransferase family protein [bacterium]